jgi:cytochrome c peroxidase
VGEACGASGSAAAAARELTGVSPTATVVEVAPAGSARGLVNLGARIFFDESLSASGRMSCATCHDPRYAYGPPNGLAVQPGGAAFDRQGVRAVPSLRYVLNNTPVWSKEYLACAAERALDQDSAPTGGLGWDGRFDSLREQAAFPLLSADEMANADLSAVGDRLRRAPYAASFRRTFGARVFDDPVRAAALARLAIERFELEDPSFHPYSSKFDDYLDGRVQLSARERRGLALFEDPARGNCASCHPDHPGADGSHPLFTDYQFEALGVPRNREIRANLVATYFDGGLCGPLRKDQASQTTYCGLFKTPTLRNVAMRHVFFHNGRFHTLKEALRFYVSRDTSPQLWYPRKPDGDTDKFDDLPAPLRGNIDITDRPLTARAGATPVWSEEEIGDVIEFLQTLTDRDAATAADGP